MAPHPSGNADQLAFGFAASGGPAPPDYPEPVPPAAGDGLDDPGLTRRSKAPAEQHFALTGKRRAVLDALRRGPLTSHDLVRVGGIRGAARVWELRLCGFDVECEPLDAAAGAYLYTLKPNETGPDGAANRPGP
jgi:hypothetical protein